MCNPQVEQTFSLCFVFGLQICRDFVILIVLLIKKYPRGRLRFYKVNGFDTDFFVELNRLLKFRRDASVVSNFFSA